MPTADVMADATPAPDPAGQVARMRQCVPIGSTVASASAQQLRSAVRSQLCPPTSTCANDCGGKFRVHAAPSPVGNVPKVNQGVPPQAPPPPPPQPPTRST